MPGPGHRTWDVSEDGRATEHVPDDPLRVARPPALPRATPVSISETRPQSRDSGTCTEGRGVPELQGQSHRWGGFPVEFISPQFWGPEV